MKHCQLVPLKTACPFRIFFVSALFKTVFHLIFNVKIMRMLVFTFGISFICNDLNLTDILSKIENALSTAIYQSEVRQLEKNIKFTVRQFASKPPKSPLDEHQNQPLQLQTTSCPQTHQHQIWASKRHFGTYRIFAQVLFNMLTLTLILETYFYTMYLHPFALCMRAAKALARLCRCTG